MSITKVVFGPKSQYQKEDCITGCARPSIQQANYGKASVRCCNDDKCKMAASSMAVLLGTE